MTDKAVSPKRERGFVSTGGLPRLATMSLRSFGTVHPETTALIGKESQTSSETVIHVIRLE
jgi:hypothetical protein